MTQRVFRCGIVGYGPAFNMGKYHGEVISKTAGLELAAVCDKDESRLEAARKDFPTVKIFSNIESMLENGHIDLVVIVTPHNTHAELALKALRAGKHVIVEKPMCITVNDANAMIDAAREKQLMLTVFHCRRLDGDFLAIKRIIEGGVVGRVFHVEAFGGSYENPGKWWRSDKTISGGAMYDWGAHFTDWILNIVPERVVGVNGYFHKLVWNDVTNEDQVEATIIFESGAVADLQLSNIAIVGKPKWRILGSKGGIAVDQGGRLILYVYSQGYRFETNVPYKGSDWSPYYTNIVEHLLLGKELLVKPEEARRVIAIMEAAERSSKSGTTERVFL